MTRFKNNPDLPEGSSTHLLWLATMGFKDHYFIFSSGDETDKIYNNGMRHLAHDLLLNLKRDNDKNIL